MSEVWLREYRAGDVDAMFALDVACFEPVFRFTPRAMRRFAEAVGAIVVIADAGEAMAGFCIVQMEGDAGYVVTLDVAPAWRRSGVAGRLMAEAERRVAAAGGTRMELHVFEGNEGAVGFYERVGYARVGAIRGFYGRGLHAAVYRKELSSPKAS